MKPPVILVMAIFSLSLGQQQTQTFTATGSYQNLNVPAGVTSMMVELTGAGGGCEGGGGAHVSGTLSVTSCEVLRIIVGKAGDSCVAVSSTDFETTLLSCPTLDSWGGGGRGTCSGGGRSAIQRSNSNGAWVELVVVVVVTVVEKMEVLLVVALQLVGNPTHHRTWTS